MNDNALSRIGVWLPYASLLITLAAFSAGAPAKLAHLRRLAPQPLVAENDFRDEPAMFPISANAFTWRGFNALPIRTAIALK